MDVWDSRYSSFNSIDPAALSHSTIQEKNKCADANLSVLDMDSHISGVSTFSIVSL